MAFGNAFLIAASRTGYDIESIGLAGDEGIGFAADAHARPSALPIVCTSFTDALNMLLITTVRLNPTPDATEARYQQHLRTFFPGVDLNF